MNIVQKTAEIPGEFRADPKNIGAQRVTPHKMPKTAPRDNT